MRRLTAPAIAIPVAVAIALALAASPAALAQPPADARWKPVDVRLAPGKVHEECLRVEAGAKRRYFWKADGPVDFNIHYHRGDEVHYPVRRDAMRGDGGTFTAPSAEDYCWMWTAGKRAVRIEGRVESP